MSNYYNEDFNIITIGEYFKNILSYQFSDTLVIPNKEYLNAIQKDYVKDFYCLMIDNDVKPKWDEDLLDNLGDYNSSYDYLIIDRDSIQSFMKSYEIMVWFILDLGYYLDMEEYKKFEFVNSIIRYENMDYVIKLERIVRNIKMYPLHIEEIENQIDNIELYNYDHLTLQ